MVVPTATVIQKRAWRRFNGDLEEADFWPAGNRSWIMISELPVILSGDVFGLDAAGGRAHFLSSAGQFVSKVMEVDLVWSAVWTTNSLPLGLTS